MVDAKKAWWTASLALLAWGCGARRVELSESNTNWLGGCEQAADCAAGMACECGVCTKNCEQADCPARLECLAECGGSCQKPCENDVDCAALNEGAKCDQGVCAIAGGVSEWVVGQANDDDALGAETGWIGLPDTTTEAPQSSGAPGGCRVAWIDYPEGAVVPMDGCGDATCRCAAGELIDCGGLAVPCEFDGNGPIQPCDEVFPDGDVSWLISPTDGFILGHTLNLTVSHAGGCARHDYAVCFDQPTEAVQRYELRFIHDAHDDSCEAGIQTSLKFDLSPMARHSMDRTGAKGGAILTQCGVYTFGELSCAQMDDAARATVADVLKDRGGSCASDDECISARLTADCAEECNVVARADQTEPFDRLLETLDVGACAGFLEQGCTPNVATCEPRDAVCRDGKCELADP